MSSNSDVFMHPSSPSAMFNPSDPPSPMQLSCTTPSPPAPSQRMANLQSRIRDLQAQLKAEKDAKQKIWSDCNNTVQRYTSENAQLRYANSELNAKVEAMRRQVVALEAERAKYKGGYDVYYWKWRAVEVERDRLQVRVDYEYERAKAEFRCRLELADSRVAFASRCVNEADRKAAALEAELKVLKSQQRC